MNQVHECHAISLGTIYLQFRIFNEVNLIRTCLEQLFAKLRELDPDADLIIELLGNGLSDRKIAEALGRKQRTFADQMKKYRTELRKIRGY